MGRTRRGKRETPGLLTRAVHKFPAASYSPTQLTRAVPSAPKGLTAVFGMGTGGAPSIWPPENSVTYQVPESSRHSFRALAPQEFYGQAARTISTGQLRALPQLGSFHTQPINVVISHGPSGGLPPGEISSWGRLRAYMPSALILPNSATRRVPLARQPVHRRFVQPGPLVLGSGPLKFPTPTRDRDRTVSRRSEPSSRTALTGEQPDPWDLLQPQDAMSRHRGAKPCRRCELLGKISLLSPAYLLSVERWPFHTEPPDH